MAYAVEIFITQITKNIRLHLSIHAWLRSLVSSWTHPFLLFLFTFAGIPVFMVLAVILCTSVIILPVSWILGWP